MPTVRILGQEIERKHLFIGGGLIAAAVAVVVFLRARAAQSTAAGAPAPQPDQGQGYGMSVAAPTGQVADQYQQQLQNTELEAGKIANRYQSNLVEQQEKQFAFQQSQYEALAPAYQAEQRSALAVETHYNTAASKAAISCPGNASVRTDPATGQLYCRQKTSGGFLGIPIGDVFRTVQNFVSGVEAAAPNIGYQTAEQAASYYTGKAFPQRTVAASSGNPASRPVQQPANPTPPARQPAFAPQQFTPGISGHGYGDI